MIPASGDGSGETLNFASHEGYNLNTLTTVGLFIVFVVIACFALWCCIKTLYKQLCFVLGVVVLYVVLEILQHAFFVTGSHTVFLESVSKLRNSVGVGAKAAADAYAEADGPS